jgi:glycosyltransferase involved in cell wall biosynthesis
MNYAEFDIETLIIFGTYERLEIAEKSLKSLLSSTIGQRVKIIVSDSSTEPNIYNICKENSNVEYIWSPNKVSMANARNLAIEYGRNKYVSDWILFLEDDLEYTKNWYTELLRVATEYYGKMSPLGLAYGIFTASPLGVKEADKISVKLENGYVASMFGPRADQRLFKASHYYAISREWESDLLGISSSQTGKVINRSLMRGYCALSIKILNLCSFLDEEESTWVGIRDIGPAAFDKRVEGYKSIINLAQSCVNIKEDPKPTSKIPMTAVPLDFKGSSNTFWLLSILKKIKQKLKL